MLISCIFNTTKDFDNYKVFKTLSWKWDILTLVVSAKNKNRQKLTHLHSCAENKTQPVSTVKIWYNVNIFCMNTSCAGWRVTQIDLKITNKIIYRHITHNILADMLVTKPKWTETIDKNSCCNNNLYVANKYNNLSWYTK